MHTMQSLMVTSGAVQLAVKTWGSSQNTPLVLVHGYPDNHAVWLPLIERLTARYYLIAYDVRGMGDSTAPSTDWGYRLEFLVADLASVIDALSPNRPVHLVAHDWGSVQSWEAVTTERLKGRIASMTSISGPSLDHMAHWGRARRRAGEFGPLLEQFARSWYVYMFQVPGLADLAWRALIAKSWPSMLARMENIEVTPHASQLRDGLNGLKLYRANFFPRLMRPQQRFAHAPVQLIVPTYDRFLTPKIYSDLEHWAPQLWRREVPTGHWFPLTQPDLLAEMVIEFVDRIDAGKVVRAPRRNRAKSGKAA